MIGGDAERAGAQFADGLLARLARTNELHHFVDVADGVDQAFEDVAALLGLFQQVARAPDDHLFAMGDEVLDQLLEPHRARLAVDQRDVDHAHRDLARRVFVELVDDDVRIGVALEVDDDAALVLPAGMVVGVADVLDGIPLHRLGDGFDDGLADHAVGDLVDDDDRLAALGLLDVHLGAEGQPPAAALVAFDNAIPPADGAAGGEIRARDDLDQLGQRAVGMIDDVRDGVADLAQVVRQEIAGHAHGDAGRAVHQQVGELGRQDRRLHEALVIVGLEIDGVEVQVGQHLDGGRGHAGLGVTHGGRRVAVG